MNSYDLMVAAEVIEDTLGIDMYLDIVFQEDYLNTYFNYNYNTSKDILSINFELDEGSGNIRIFNVKKDDFENVIDFSVNKVVEKHIERQGRFLN
tara:strand:+ start:5263 stop:5547 length:285 start_codon:yes stop_codon:yes gene_type:complete